MKHRFSQPAGQMIVSLATVMIVFGLAILMVIGRYSPTVITTVVTGTSLAASELVHRVHALASPPPDPDHNPAERS